MDTPQLYTITEVARILRVSRATVYSFMASGALGYVIVGQHRRIPAEALQRFLREPEPVAAREGQQEPR